MSYFEAAAYALWRSRVEGTHLRLPTEVEWEHVAPMKHMLGNVWEWTNSAYLPHPGFRPYDGTIQEYNGKFMSNKMVLKGGSWATPAEHIRVSYRNFWPLAFRFAAPGIRLLREPS